jgi:hypothetical protein
MDFLDPAKKRAHKIRLIVGYILIGVMVALITTILVFQSYGFDLDRKTGAIIQNGLLYVAAQPQPADVILNGKKYASQNNIRLVLPSDIYTLQLQRTGYRSWKRTLSLAGGTIERITYPWLFPNKLVTASQRSYTGQPTFASTTPDRTRLVIQKPGQLNVFDVIDATDPTKTATSLTVPPTVFTNPDQGQLKLIKWSSDNRHMLVQHIYDGGQEFVMIDRQTPASSFNIDKTFARVPTNVEMRDNHFDHLYLYDQAAKTLDYVEQKTPTNIKPILAGVLGFKSYGTDLILYALETGAAEGKANIMVHDNDGDFLLRSVTASPTYALNLTQYNNNWYVAAGGSGDGRVYVYKNPFPIIKKQSKDPLFPITALRVTNPQWLEFSSNAQFLAAEDGTHFAVYDAENDHTYRYDTQLPLATPEQHAAWMDGNRLDLVSSGKTKVFDYDGLNRQTLTVSLPGLPVMFDRDYKYLYNLAPSGADNAQASLTRTDLLVK